MENKPSTSQDIVSEEVQMKRSKDSKMKPKKDTKKDVEKDSGIAGNKRGIDYHYYVAMCLLLEGYKYKQDNPEYEYILSQEDNKAGMFDDLVYQYKNNISEPWTRLLVQIKNKKSDNKIKTSNLLHDDKKETYSLIKFLNSSKEIKDTENCFFLLYTNASFELEENGHLRKCYKKDISLQPSQVNSIPIIDTGCQYQFDKDINADIFHQHTNIPKEEWKRFFSKFLFVAGQPDLEEMKSAVEKKIEDILPKGTEIIWHRLYEMVNASLLKKYPISLDEISKLIEKSKTDIQMPYDNKYEESVIEFKCNIPLREFFLSNTSTTLPIRSNNSEFTLYKVSKIIKQLREEKPDVKQYTMKHVYSIKQVMDIQTATAFNLLIININNDMLLQLFTYIPKNYGQKYIIIIPNEMNLSVIPNCYQVCEDKINSFQMLTDESKKYILEKKCVLLNDKKTSFSDILKFHFNDLKQEQTKELNDVITEDVIQCFLSDDYRDLKIEYNRLEINDLGKCNYIQRYLYYSVIIEENKIKEFKELHIIDNLDKFKKQCNENPDRTCHHFKKYKTFLIWNQSNGDLTYLREFINKNRASDTISLQTLWEDESIAFAIKEDKLCNLHNKNNTILIADKPGMGKTLLMSNLYYNLQKNDPSCLIIRLNLNDHTDAFNKKTNFSNLETILAFLTNILIETKSSKLSQNVLNFVLKNQHHIFLILDGVDELCPEYKNTVFNFIKILNDLKIARLFVTTRPAQAVSLEKITSQFALSIKPFTKEDQLLYLNKILNKKTDNNNLLNKINENSSLKDLLGVPLLLNIVTEIINNSNDDEYNIEDILNLSQLFSIFVSQKFHIYSIEKKNQEVTNPTIMADELLLQKIYRESHEILALKLIFAEEIIQNKFDKDLNEQKIKIGIITKITDQKAEFIHRTFAEYFVSTYIQKHFNEVRVMELMFTNILTENDLSGLRKFINNYIQSEFKNNETKNKYKVLATCIHTNVNENSILLSILFTAAHENNKETFDFIFECFSKNINYLEKMLCYESNNTKAIPLQAAIRKGNIEIAKQLIIYCLENDINKESKAFKYMLGVGDTRGYTALFDSARGGYIDIVQILLNRGADVNICDNNGFTALRTAAYNGHTETVNVLLNRGADVNKGDNDGFTALYTAAQNGHTETVSVLLNRGADVNKGDNDGFTALYTAAQNGHTETVNVLLNRGADVNICDTDGSTALRTAAQNGHTETVNVLLNRGAYVNICDNDGWTALYTAAQNGHTETVNVLLNRGADVNIGNNNGSTALRTAAYNGHTETVNVLLNRGADVNKGDNDGFTALYTAAQNGHTETVSVLLNRGADVNKGDNDGFTALYTAAQNGHTETVNVLLNRGADVNICDNDGSTALRTAAQNGHTETVNVLLNRGAYVNICDNDGWTALYTAAQNGHTETVNVLLNRGADVNIGNNNGSTALRTAAYNGHTETVNVLLNRGAYVNKGDNDGFTALYTAAQNGHTETVNVLLNRGADVNKGDNDGSTALYTAAQNGHTETVNILLNRGADVNICDNDGWTALHTAAQNGHTETVNVLLNRGADVNICDNDGSTALRTATYNGHTETVNILLNRGADVNKGDNDGFTALYTAAQNGHTETVNVLLNRGADVNIGNNNGSTALRTAAYNGHTETVNVLLNRGAYVNKGDNDGFTALYTAAQNGHTETVNVLLNRGADVNKGDNDGSTALYTAAQNGHTETVNILLNRGADVNICDNDGWTALHTAAQNGHTETVNVLLNRGADVNICDNDGSTALHTAAYNGHTETVNVLLNRGADVNICDNDGSTALHTAAYNGHTETVNILLNRGADVNICDNDGWTALHTAAQNGHTETVNVLLNRGADVNICDNDGSTALRTAAYNGHTETVNILLNRGADVNKGDNDGFTALYTAAQNGHTETVNVLLNRGADVNIGNNNGSTALRTAAYNGHTETVNVLLNRGADVNKGDNDGFTALYTAAQNGHTETVNVLLNRGADVNKGDNDGSTALYTAAQNGHTETVNVLLNRGADVNKGDNDGWTALHTAASNGHTDTVNTLVDRGADVNKGDIDGDTPLHLVASRGHTDTMYVLLDRGANINKASINEFTPLHWTVMYNSVVSTRVLLERGADVNISNDYGERALQLAYRTGNYKLVQLLLRHENDLYDHNDSDSDSGSDSITKLHIAVWRYNADDVEFFLTKCDINTGDSHNRTPLYWAALLGECDIMRVLLSGGADVNIRDINDSTILQAAFRSGNYRAVQLLLRHNNSELYNYYNTDSQ